MSRASIADRSRLLWLALRRKINVAAGRLLVSPLAALVFWPRRSERLVIAPQELRTTDPTRAAEIYSGRFSFAGKTVVCEGRSPFEVDPPTPEWGEMLLGFAWLRHLRAANSTKTRASARALVDEWITQQGSWHRAAWQPEILSRRLMSWFSQATLILEDADLQFYRRLLRSLTRQVRFLRVTANDTRDGMPRLQARIALTYATLCMAKQVRHLRGTTRRLVAELERQILPDGGHISRNPGVIIEILLDLLPLSQAFAARNVPP
ncbi:MAG: heparinase, partial [Bradyrhizobiaceae bacterium]|nr:heparinase [Bradyrhizobiaceae bacterium]